jgi:hypothetical protein
MLRRLREHTVGNFVPVKEVGHGPVKYPPDHVPGMEVPKGGSMCANCKFLKDPKKRICGEPNFIAWNGSEIIPLAIDQYCSDWYQPRKAT